MKPEDKKPKKRTPLPGGLRRKDDMTSSALERSDAAAKRREEGKKFKSKDPGKVRDIKARAEDMFDQM